MKILWDFRLFSYGYRDRGVGVFTARVAEAILNAGYREEIYIWAQREKVPESLRDAPARWVEYRPRSWKNDLFDIPAMLYKYRIDLMHYWVACGPIFGVGMGLFHPCKSCCIVHDCGVWLWNDVAQCVRVRKTWYWKFQKNLVRRASAVVCDSMATLSDFQAFSHANQKKSVIYAPGGANIKFSGNREKKFVVLSGPSHKNVGSIVKAFCIFRKTHTDFTLSLFGDECTNERSSFLHSEITIEPMRDYARALCHSWGMLFCSFHEGLGLPPLEAMSQGCPVIVSDIPVFHETCGDSAIYVDPRNIESIARGMEELAVNGAFWRQKALEGKARYDSMSLNAGEKWLALYKTMDRARARKS